MLIISKNKNFKSFKSNINKKIILYFIEIKKDETL